MDEKVPGATSTKIFFDRTGRSTGKAEVQNNTLFFVTKY